MPEVKIFIIDRFSASGAWDKISKLLAIATFDALADLDCFHVISRFQAFWARCEHDALIALFAVVFDCPFVDGLLGVHVDLTSAGADHKLELLLAVGTRSRPAHPIGTGFLNHNLLTLLIRTPKIKTLKLTLITFDKLASLRLADKPCIVLHPAFRVGAFQLRPEYIAAVLVAEVCDEDFVCDQAGLWRTVASCAEDFCVGFYHGRLGGTGL